VANEYNILANRSVRYILGIINQLWILASQHIITTMWNNNLACSETQKEFRLYILD